MNSIKQIIAFLFLVFIATKAEAQVNEVGVFLGGANPISDVGRQLYVFPNNIAFGVHYKRNVHNRYSLRAGVNRITLSAADAQAFSQGMRYRDLRFRNDLIEVNAGAEFNFFPYEMKRSLGRPFTPYVYTGLSFLWYNNLYYNLLEGNEAIPTGRVEKTLAIPLALGVKMRVSSRLILGFEVMGRYAFTNNLDGGSPTHDRLLKVGNQNSFDGFSTIGLMLTYTFGEYPCNCSK